MTIENHVDSSSNDQSGRLDVPPGNVLEFSSMKDLAHSLEVRGMLKWWKTQMGYEREEEPKK